MKTERCKHQIPISLATGNFMKAVGVFDDLCVNC